MINGHFRTYRVANCKLVLSGCEIHGCDGKITIGTGFALLLLVMYDLITATEHGNDWTTA